MATPDLGTLEFVDVRSAWENEARDFTPWLLEHAERLAETLGIELELHQAEHPVGSFSLDLIGRDLTNNCELIVENQLAPTDHGHLGQLMTYAAGTKAQTIVWIATEFREEHREAIRWLNQIGGDDARFFGIEVGLVRIGASQLAPIFKLRAEPNEWGAVIAHQSGDISAREAQYREYWAKFLAAMHERHPTWSNARKPGKASWLSMPSNFSGCRWSVSFASKQRLMSELYIDSGDGDTNAAIFARFLAARTVIEATFGGNLAWEELPDRRASRIAHYGEGHVTDTANHVTYIDWMFDAQERMRAAFEVAKIDLRDIS